MKPRTGPFDGLLRVIRRHLLSLLLGLVSALPVLADQYDYANRGDRYEGTLAQPVSGDDIVLISARVAPVGGPAAPARMRLTFYLPEREKVNVTVRELDNRFYYWMDKVDPPTPWRSKTTNSFQWPTQDVLQWLYGRGLTPADLGAVVRLAAGDTPSAREHVAPALLSGDDAQVAPRSYLFSFKSNLPARLTCALYPDRGVDPVWSKDFHRVSAGRPFTCRVPFGGLKKGNYRLEVDGYSLDTSAPIRQQVRFFHSPDLR
jgi:hypothetical protein